MTDKALVESGTVVMGIALVTGPVAILAYFAIKAAKILKGR